jgi:iron complex outermembrane recepter protein
VIPRADRDGALLSRTRRYGLAALLSGACALMPTESSAQTCDPPALVDATWPAPLDQRVTVRGGELTLRDALDRLAAASGVRLSWSDASLALDTRVCLDATRAPIGAVLSALTMPFSVTPRVAGDALIVLAPTPRVERPRAPALRTVSLERVVVTGTLNGAAQRGLTTALSVVGADALASRGTGDVAQFLNGAVPGVWVWSQAPMALTARYGSIRGASSFGVSVPKVYIDGVEVANPLVVAHLPAESIDRLEVLRGPQGAALYGTDAISGVVQILTRPPSRIGSAPGLSLRARAGTLNSAYGDASSLSDEYVVSGQAGSTARAVAGALSLTRAGAYVPDGESRQLAASARARLIGTRHVLEGTVRAVAADVAMSNNPLLLTAMRSGLTLPDSLRRLLTPARAERWLDSLASRLALDRSPRQAVRQVTAGVTGTLHGDVRWTHRATLGVDAYTLDGTSAGPSPLPSSADSALRAAEGSAMRASGRLSSAATWRGDAWRRTLTFSTEHALLREATSNLVLARPRPVAEGASDALATVWRQTNGVVAQLDTDWRERWYVTAGTRVERSAGFTDRALVSVLPMLGTAFVVDAAPVSAKVRAAYGKGIRPPRATIGANPVARATLLANASLEAEEQAGTEVGVDLHAGTHASLHITRFDQRATGLVQPVTVLTTTSTPPPPGGAPSRPGDPLQRNLAYQLQNVGAISNRGWELSAAARGGPIAVTATLATVDSRVDAVRRSYTGELRVGDRVLDVPARTYGLTAQFVHNGWELHARTTRVEDWIGYDRLAAAEAFASSRRPSGEFVGGALRQFWMRYPGVTRVGATVTRALRGDLSLQLIGENLLDVQTGEPDNATILPGRLVTIGVRARF